MSVNPFKETIIKLYDKQICFDLDWDFTDAVSFLRLRPRLLASGLKRWDLYWDFWFVVLNIETETHFSMEWTQDRDWCQPSLSLVLKT